MTTASLYHRSRHDKDFRTMLKATGSLHRLEMIKRMPRRYLDYNSASSPQLTGASAGAQESPVKIPMAENRLSHSISSSVPTLPKISQVGSSRSSTFKTELHTKKTGATETNDAYAEEIRRQVTQQW